MQLLTNGAKVRLWSFAHGMSVRITDSGTVDGNGRGGNYGKCVYVCVCVCVLMCVCTSLYVQVCVCVCV